MPTDAAAAVSAPAQLERHPPPPSPPAPHHHQQQQQQQHPEDHAADGLLAGTTTPSAAAAALQAHQLPAPPARGSPVRCRQRPDSSSSSPVLRPIASPDKQPLLAMWDAPGSAASLPPRRRGSNQAGGAAADTQPLRSALLVAHEPHRTQQQQQLPAEALLRAARCQDEGQLLLTERHGNVAAHVPLVPCLPADPHQHQGGSNSGGGAGGGGCRGQQQQPALSLRQHRSRSAGEVAVVPADARGGLVTGTQLQRVCSTRPTTAVAPRFSGVRACLQAAEKAVARSSQQQQKQQSQEARVHADTSLRRLACRKSARSSAGQQPPSDDRQAQLLVRMCAKHGLPLPQPRLQGGQQQQPGAAVGCAASSGSTKNTTPLSARQQQHQQQRRLTQQGGEVARQRHQLLQQLKHNSMSRRLPGKQKQAAAVGRGAVSSGAADSADTLQLAPRVQQQQQPMPGVVTAATVDAPAPHLTDGLGHVHALLDSIKLPCSAAGGGAQHGAVPSSTSCNTPAPAHGQHAEAPAMPLLLPPPPQPQQQQQLLLLPAGLQGCSLAPAVGGQQLQAACTTALKALRRAAEGIQAAEGRQGGEQWHVISGSSSAATPARGRMPLQDGLVALCLATTLLQHQQQPWTAASAASAQRAGLFAPVHMQVLRHMCQPRVVQPQLRWLAEARQLQERGLCATPRQLCIRAVAAVVSARQTWLQEELAALQACVLQVQRQLWRQQALAAHAVAMRPASPTKQPAAGTRSCQPPRAAHRAAPPQHLRRSAGTTAAATGIQLARAGAHAQQLPASVLAKRLTVAAVLRAPEELGAACSGCWQGTPVLIRLLTGLHSKLVCMLVLRGMRSVVTASQEQSALVLAQLPHALRSVQLSAAFSAWRAFAAHCASTRAARRALRARLRAQALRRVLTAWQAASKAAVWMRARQQALQRRRAKELMLQALRAWVLFKSERQLSLAQNALAVLWHARVRSTQVLVTWADTTQRAASAAAAAAVAASCCSSSSSSDVFISCDNGSSDAGSGQAAEDSGLVGCTGTLAVSLQLQHTWRASVLAVVRASVQRCGEAWAAAAGAAADVRRQEPSLLVAAALLRQACQQRRQQAVKQQRLAELSSGSEEAQPYHPSAVSPEGSLLASTASCKSIADGAARAALDASEEDEQQRAPVSEAASLMAEGSDSGEAAEVQQPSSAPMGFIASSPAEQQQQQPEAQQPEAQQHPRPREVSYGAVATATAAHQPEDSARLQEQAAGEQRPAAPPPLEAEGAAHDAAASAVQQQQETGAALAVAMPSQRELLTAALADCTPDTLQAVLQLARRAVAAADDSALAAAAAGLAATAAEAGCVESAPGTAAAPLLASRPASAPTASVGAGADDATRPPSPPALQPMSADNQAGFTATAAGLVTALKEAAAVLLAPPPCTLLDSAAAAGPAADDQFCSAALSDKAPAALAASGHMDTEQQQQQQWPEESFNEGCTECASLVGCSSLSAVLGTTRDAAAAGAPATATTSCGEDVAVLSACTDSSSSGGAATLPRAAPVSYPVLAAPATPFAPAVQLLQLLRRQPSAVPARLHSAAAGGSAMCDSEVSSSNPGADLRGLAAEVARLQSAAAAAAADISQATAAVPAHYTTVARVDDDDDDVKEAASTQCRASNVQPRAPTSTARPRSGGRHASQQRLVAAAAISRRRQLVRCMRHWLWLVRGRLLLTRVFWASEAAWSARGAGGIVNVSAAPLVQDFQRLRGTFRAWRQHAAARATEAAAVAALEAAAAYHACRIRVAVFGGWREHAQQQRAIRRLEQRCRARRRRALLSTVLTSWRQAMAASQQALHSFQARQSERAARRTLLLWRGLVLLLQHRRNEAAQADNWRQCRLAGAALQAWAAAAAARASGRAAEHAAQQHYARSLLRRTMLQWSLAVCALSAARGFAEQTLLQRAVRAWRVEAAAARRALDSDPGRPPPEAAALSGTASLQVVPDSLVASSVELDGGSSSHTSSRQLQRQVLQQAIALNLQVQQLAAAATSLAPAAWPHRN